MTSSPRLLRLFLLALLASSMLTACQTGPKVETTVTETPDSVVMVQTVRMQATVEAIDATTRTVRLQPGHGDSITLKIREDAVNFQNVRVGDEVHATYVEETAVTLVPGGALPSVGTGRTVKLAPQGGKPGVIAAQALEVTATVVAIDARDHTVTLRFKDGGTREIDVPKSRDLSQVGLGDSVRVQLTEAVALSVVKPQ